MNSNDPQATTNPETFDRNAQCCNTENTEKMFSITLTKHFMFLLSNNKDLR